MVEQECSLFYKPELKQKCLEIVDNNIDFIIDSVVKNADPKEICKGIALCAKKTLNKEVNVDVERYMVKYTEQPQCVLCQLVMTKLEHQLKDRKTEEELEQALRGVCKKLPANYKSKCDKFIEEYTELIISLVDAIPPKELCGQINLCRETKVDSTRSMYTVLPFFC